ncbi:MAG: hypothetical protein ACD_2C00231G0001 [uncultured bacterium (gcode 4)]|uniref:Uncharacterized protein n=1 Tax=uncultured bacterium (gcode 4) TaxID=1234023 RepID=K2H012_9BACT|nr:MAG: hypothetical protein ACD_2C00231G0001 [uncultured bacterium (gcode 4)]
MKKSLPFELPYQGEISLERTRFPYTLKVGEKVIATIFTSRMNDAFLNLFEYAVETNRLKRRVNRLIELAERGGLQLPDEQTRRENEIDLSIKEDAEDLFKLYGLRAGQIYKSKRAEYWYELTEINGMKGLITLHWLGEPEYTRDVDIKSISKGYVLWEDEIAENLLDFCKVKSWSI